MFFFYLNYLSKLATMLILANLSVLYFYCHLGYHTCFKAKIPVIIYMNIIIIIIYFYSIVIII